jgi:DNA primase catalytic core
MQKIRDIESVRELLRAECRIEDVARSLYNIDLRQSGSDNLKACCPFHKEDTPSFGISKSKQFYHCFGCHAGGDVFKLVQELENVEHMDAIRRLAEFASFDLSPYKVAYTDADRQIQELYNINADVVEYAVKQRGHDAYQSWLARRKFDPSILDEYSVGYSHSALGRDDVPAADEAQARSLGLDRSGAWAGSIVVPVRDAYGRVGSFRNRPIGGTLKVIGPESGHVLPVSPFYGLYEARKHIRSTGYLLLVEGEPDVWQLASHGYRNVAACIGSKLNDEMLAILADLSVRRVVLLADRDEPGRKFARSVAEARHSSTTILVRIARLRGNGKDPDEVLLADGEEPIAESIAEAKYAFEYLIERICEEHNAGSRSDQLEILHDVKSKIKGSAPLERELVARRLSEILALDYEVVLDFFREDDGGQQSPLQNVLAERVVLKRMLTDAEFIGDAILGVKSGDFYLSKNRAIFDAICKLYRAQEVISADTVRVYSENATGDGWRSTIDGIMADSVDTTSAMFMLADMRDKSLRRNVQKQARDAANLLSNTKADAREVVSKLSADLSAATVVGGAKLQTIVTLVQDRVQLMHERIKAPNAIIGLDLGPDWPVINHTIHGLQRKRYVIVAAPAGVGKTALAGAVAKRVAVDLGHPTLYFTFETGTDALTDRLIANYSGVESDKFITGHVTREEAAYIHEAAEKIAASPLLMTERGVEFTECISIIRHDVMKRGTRLVVVDYLQLMQYHEFMRERRDIELGQISRGLFLCAHELDITIIAVAQQNREAAKQNQANKEGIGESYKISQDADLMLFMREKTKDEIDADGPEKGNRIINIGKHRHGKGNIIVNAIADLDIMRICEYSSRAMRQ